MMVVSENYIQRLEDQARTGTPVKVVYYDR